MYQEPGEYLLDTLLFNTTGDRAMLMMILAVAIAVFTHEVWVPRLKTAWGGWRAKKKGVNQKEEEPDLR